MKLSLKLMFSHLLLFIVTASSTNHYKSEAVIENEIFLKRFSFSKDEPDKIYIEFLIKNNFKVISNSKNIPIFEFVINNQLITSNDKFWVFRNQSKRDMLNGGIEYRLVFEGVKDAVDGLKIILL